MKVSLPHMGEYSRIIAQELQSRLGWDIILPPPNSSRSLSLGASQLNELICLPAKVTLGNMIEACQAGATDLMQFDSCGLCRLKSYYLLQQQALNRLGYRVKVHPLQLGLVATPRSLRRVDPSVSWGQAYKAFYYALRAIIKYEPQQPSDGQSPRIGIVGEIYSVLDSFVNHNLFDKLQKLGCFVHNSIPLSYFAFKRLYRWGWMKRKDMDNTVLRQAQKAGHELFPKNIGGHGNESIIHTIYYGMMGYDGVVHVAPFPCMPEFTVASVMDEVAHHYNTACLRLTFDQHSADAGLVTRLEAFVDMLKRKH